MSQWGSCVQNAPNKLISSLFNQKEAGKFCDIRLKFGEVELNAHACVVASFSTLVDNMCTTRQVMPPLFSADPCLLFKLDVPLIHSNFSCLDCASKVIDFMYVGKIQIDDQHLEHIRIVSEGLQVSELMKICKKHSDKQEVRKKKCIENESPSFSSQPTSCGSSEVEMELAVSKSKLTIDEELLSRLSNPQRESEMDLVPTFPSDASTENMVDDALDENEWRGIKCPKCDVVVMCLAKYQQHCSSHLGKTYTTCYVCNYASIRVPDVIKHLQEKNHGEKICSLCLLECNSSQSLKEHLQLHDQPQPFFCLTCNTRFQTRTALNSHIVRHTNETPFVCKECGRGFKWKHGLQSHMVTHSKLKPFLCDQCGFSTAHLKSFIDHKTMHSGEKFKCPKPDCQFKSVRKESVKHHLMTHSKQKPYQCEVCGQAFSQSKNLRRHAASHNQSADPERCPLCPYQTSRSDKFKAHFKRFHKDGEQANIKRETKKKSAMTCGNISLNLESNEKLSSSDNAAFLKPEEGAIVNCGFDILPDASHGNKGKSGKQPLNNLSLNVCHRTFHEDIPNENVNLSYGRNPLEEANLVNLVTTDLCSKSTWTSDSSSLTLGDTKSASELSLLPILSPYKPSGGNVEEALRINNPVITILSNPLCEEPLFQPSVSIDLNYFTSLVNGGKAGGEKNMLDIPAMTNLPDTDISDQLIGDNQGFSTRDEETITDCCPNLHFEMNHAGKSVSNIVSEDSHSAGSAVYFPVTSDVANTLSFKPSDMRKQEEGDPIVIHPQFSFQSLESDSQNDQFVIMHEQVRIPEDDNLNDSASTSKKIFILNPDHVMSSTGEIYLIPSESLLIMNSASMITQSATEQNYSMVLGEDISDSLNVSNIISGEAQTEPPCQRNLETTSCIVACKSIITSEDKTSDRKLTCENTSVVANSESYVVQSSLGEIEDLIVVSPEGS